MRKTLSRPTPLRVLASRPLLALALALVSSPAFLTAQTSVHGVVLNSATREPIARALVTNGDSRFAALTDDQGRFSFTIPPPPPSPGQAGAVEMNFFRASRPGFLEDSGGAPWKLGDPSPDGKDIVLTLTPESLIVGRVNLPSSGSFDRISVELYRRQIADGRPRWLPAGTARARTNGDFRFAELPAGTYKLFTQELLDRDPLTFDPNGQQYGYPPAYYPAATDFASAASIALTAGQTAQVELTPTLQPYYPVKIHVPDSQSANVNVSVAPVGHYGPGFTLGFNPGDQSIDGMLPNGTYTVEAIRYGNQPASGSLTFTVRNAPLRSPTLLLIPGGTIPVNLKEEAVASDKSSGAARPGHVVIPRLNLTITLAPADDFSPLPGAGLRPRTSMQDTSLALTGVLPGRYWVRVDDADFYPVSITSNGIDLLANPLVVAPGGSSEPIDVTARNDMGEIDGTVELDSSDPPPATQNLTVYCLPLPDSTGRFAQASVQPTSGALSFQCPSLPPGGYRILAFDRPQPDLEYHNPDAMRPYESKSTVVHLAGNQKETTRVPLIRE